MRAERRRAFGFEELSPPEIAPSSVKVRPRLIVYFTLLNPTLILSVNLCARLRSCTWTSAPRWTLRVTETAAPVPYPPTAPGNLPTQCCRTRHVSHPLLQKAFSHSAAGQYVQKSCSHNRIRRAVVSFVRNLRRIFLFFLFFYSATVCRFCCRKVPKIVVIDKSEVKPEKKIKLPSSGCVTTTN